MLKKSGTVNIKSVLSNILYIIIIPIILYDVILIIKTIINPSVTPDFLGIKTFSIVSGSMKPTINIDDIIIVKECGMEELEINDIITFNVDNELITHRIINTEYIDNNLIYTTKGDNNEVTDIKKITYNQIEGKYVGKIPKLGKLLNFIKNKYVFYSILFVLLVCVYEEKKQINRRINRKQKRIKYEQEKRLQK